MMKHLRRSTVLSVFVALVLAAFVGCKGPTGPRGEKGDPGLPGAGERTLITGTVPNTEEDNIYPVSIPELTLDDFPLVSVFVQISENEWDELPFFWADLADQPLWASMSEGMVTLYNCRGLAYIIVIIQ